MTPSEANEWHVPVMIEVGCACSGGVGRPTRDEVVGLERFAPACAVPRTRGHGPRRDSVSATPDSWHGRAGGARRSERAVPKVRAGRQSKPRKIVSCGVLVKQMAEVDVDSRRSGWPREAGDGERIAQRLPGAGERRR